MEDALRDGDVVPDPDRTIDAQTRDDHGDPPFQASPPASDYAELAQVERRHYMVVREIAKGGMGRVLEARDLRLGRQVAIKELLPRNRDATRRFEREARITARLQHPGIIHVYEAGVWPGGEPFYAMPKVTGRSLDKVVAERATLADRLGLVTTVMAVADALAYAHSEHVIHRDLKPTNVLVGEFGQTVVIDWGLAKELDAATELETSQSFRDHESPAEHTASGSVVGTPAYMPPEQARGDTVDQRADVYAIGALLYKVLCGHAPYVGDSSDAILDHVKTHGPPPIQDREPGAPRELVAIVEKAMAREPRARYVDAGELAQDLKRFETGQLVAAHRYTTRQLMWRFVRRHRVAIVMGLVALATLAIGSTVSVRSILAAKARTETKRYALLEERGRTELAEGRAGPALAYLVNAAHDRVISHAREFLLAEAIRPFLAELQTLPAGAGAVRVAVSPDGSTIATAASSLVVWRGGRPVELAKARFNAIAFDHAGNRIVVGGDDGVVRLWPVAGGPPVEMPGRDAILDVVFSPDDRLVAAAGHDGDARVWDVTTGTLLTTTKCHSAPVLSVRFSPDGSAIATASQDHTACVWSVDNNQLIALLRGHNGAVRSARWSADGNRVVTASDDGTAWVWDARLAKPLYLALVHDKAVVAAELAGDGETVVTASADHTARVWRLPEATAPAQDAPLPEPQVVARLIGHTDAIVAAAISPDGALVATGSLDRLAKVWDASTGELLATFEHPDVVSDLAFAGNDRLVTGDRGGSGHVWDIKKSVVARGRYVLRSPIHAIAVHAGELAVGTDDSHVTLWPGERVLREHLGRVLAVGFAAGGARLVSAGEDAQSIVWDVATGKPRCRITHPDDEPARYALATTGDRVAIASDEIVTLWSTDDCSAQDKLDDKGTVIGAIAAAGERIAIGAGDGTVVIWNVATREKKSLAVMKAAVTALAFSPDGLALAVACEGEAKIINPSGERLALDGPVGKVTAIGWLDDARVVTASRDGIASVWDVAKGKLLGVRGAAGEALSSLAIDGNTMWLGGKDGIASAWDVGVLTRTVDELDTFLAEHTQWTLGEDDVVRRSEGSGADDGHH